MSQSPPLAAQTSVADLDPIELWLAGQLLKYAEDQVLPREVQCLLMKSYRQGSLLTLKTKN